jgi:hypothetical protein
MINPEGLSKSALKKLHKKQAALAKKVAKRAELESKGLVIERQTKRQRPDGSSTNVLEHLPAFVHLLVSSCTGVEHVLERETAERFAGLDFTDLFQACISVGFYELEDSKIWSFGSGIFTGKYALSVPSRSSECETVSTTIRTVSMLNSAEHISMLISFVPGGIHNPFRADSAAFIASLEMLEDGGPAGSIEMWRKAFSLWKEWRSTVGKFTEQEAPLVPRFRVTTQQTPKKFHPFTENQMGQALARGIESQLGWQPDVANFEVEVSCRLREHSVLVSMKLHQGRLQPSKQPLHLTYSLCASLGMSPAQAQPSTLVAYDLGECGSEARAMLSSSFPSCFIFVNEHPAGAASASADADDGTDAGDAPVTSQNNVDRLLWDSHHLPFRTSALDKVCSSIVFKDQKPTAVFPQVRDLT